MSKYTENLNTIIYQTDLTKHQTHQQQNPRSSLVHKKHFPEETKC